LRLVHARGGPLGFWTVNEEPSTGQALTNLEFTLEFVLEFMTGDG
jgi:hypothetical protein